MPSIIFVCTSNVCRSPAAAGLAMKWAADNNREDFTFQSRSLSEDYEPVGSPPSTHSADIMMAEFNVDISSHRSALLTPEDVAKADIIVGITRRHADVINSRFPGMSCYTSYLFG
jgi:protein-tyrosine phosphatase